MSAPTLLDLQRRPIVLSAVPYNTVRVTSTPYNILDDDFLIAVDTDGGDVTVNLPAGTSGQSHYKIINCGSSGNDVTVNPNGAEKLFGDSSLTLYDGEVADIHFEATEGWW